MNIFQEINDVLGEILDLEAGAITSESYLVRELGAESIDLLELAAALNARFRIEVREEDVFLTGLGTRRSATEFPFLPEERAQELAVDLADGPAVKVKDLVSYVAWQLKKAGHVFS